ncbi:hypothetical protein [Kitasatospora sp. NPDC096140]|uniref:hypothetical protein n=1 Tax=Kitasatospora sp. NPDC096140 TaxID=3155425 RepID=UPI0033286370
MTAPLRLVPAGPDGPDGPDDEAHLRPSRPLHAIARISHGPVALDFDRIAAEFPAVRSGLALAGEADLELRLVCTGPEELRTISAALYRAGAARVHIDLVLRTLTPAPVTLRPVP